MAAPMTAGDVRKMDPQQVRERIERIRARHDAATPGPWRWYGYVRGRGIMHSKATKRRCEQVYLSTEARGRIYIMQFERVGFNDAQPVFQFYRDPEKRHENLGGGRMVGAGELAGGPDGYLKEYSGEFVGIDNQDAIAIEKSWEDVDFLLAENERRAKQICALLRCHVRQEFEQGNHDDACPLDTGYVPTWLREEAPTP